MGFPFVSSVLVVLVCFLVVGTVSAFATFAGGNGRIAVLTVDGRVGLVESRAGSGFEVLPFSAPVVDVGGFSQQGGLFSALRDSGGVRFVERFDLASKKTARVGTVTSADFVSVSADETRIAYVDSDTHRLWVRDLRSGVEAQENPFDHLNRVVSVDDAQVSWSAGNQLAFKPRNSSVIDAQMVGGRDVKRVSTKTSKLDKDAVFPDWSPDGSRLLYTSNASPGRSKLVIVNADGSNLRSVTRYGYERLRGVFSPDGTKIAYLKLHNGRRQLFTRNALTREEIDNGVGAADVQQITNFTAKSDPELESLAWQPLPQPALQPGSNNTPNNNGGGNTPTTPSGPEAPTRPGVPNRPTSQTFRDRHAPTITGLKLSRKTLPATLKGGQLQLSLSEPAQVTIQVRKGKKTVLTVRKQAKAGKNQIILASKRKLRPGRYQLHVSAKDPRGNTTKPQTLVFQVRKR